MGIWGNAFQTPITSSSAAESQVTTSLAYLGQSVEAIVTVIDGFESWFSDYESPNFYMPTVAWENVDAAALMSYIDTLKAQFVVSPTIPTIDTGTMPTVNLPDVVEVQDTTLVDTIKNKLKNNINNLAYGLETADASGIATRAFDRAARGSSSQTMALLSSMGSFGVGIPADVYHAINDHAELNEYNKAVADSDRFVAVGINETYTKDYKATRESGIRLAAWLLEEYVKEIETIVFAFEAQIDGYVKKIEAKNLVIKGEYDYFEARVKAFVAMVEAATKVADIAMKNLDTTNSVYKERIALAVDHFKLAVRKMLGADGIYLDSGASRMASFSGMAAAALSQYNASASISESYGMGTSNSSHEGSNDQASVSVSNQGEARITINSEEPVEDDPPLPGGF